MKSFREFKENYNSTSLKRLVESLFNDSINEQEIKFEKSLIGIFKEIGNTNQIAEWLFNKLEKKFSIEIDGEMKNVEEIYPHPSKADTFEIHYTKPNGSKAKQEMKVGKFINKLVIEIKDKYLNPKPQEIEDFVKKFFAQKSGDVESLYKFKLVSGKDIMKYYDEKSYETNKGGLGASCMRDSIKNGFMQFYTDLDPKICSLLIYIDESTDKIVGRALLWKLDSGEMYLDRVYVTDNKIMTLFLKYAEKTYKVRNNYDKNELKDIETITVKSTQLGKQMPYMDTFFRAIEVDKNLILFSSGNDDNIKIDKFLTSHSNWKQRFIFRHQTGHFDKIKNPLTISEEFAKNFKFADGLTIEKILEDNDLKWILEIEAEKATIGYDNENDLIIWYDGIFHDGVWKTGVWKKGIWKKGIWRGGVWKGGTWENGHWDYGDWSNGIWENGTWVNGIWRGGTWKDGFWERGTWKDGTWKKGTWKKGTWENGTWKDGTWKDGIWQNGIWQKGTWEDGTWVDGTWIYGTWKRGTWKNGTWRKGFWENGFWENGVWNNGAWKVGTWENGIWKDGIWINGMWKKGTWENGTWNYGTGKPENA